MPFSACCIRPNKSWSRRHSRHRPSAIIRTNSRAISLLWTGVCRMDTSLRRCQATWRLNYGAGISLNRTSPKNIHERAMGHRPVRRRRHRPHARPEPCATAARLPVRPGRPAVLVLRRLEVAAVGYWPGHAGCGTSGRRDTRVNVGAHGFRKGKAECVSAHRGIILEG